MLKTCPCIPKNDRLLMNILCLSADYFLDIRWFFTPRASAALIVAERCQHLIRSTVPTSHGFRPKPRKGQRIINNPFPPAIGSPFKELYGFVGTTNNDAYLTVATAMEFREKVCGGEPNIMDYCIRLAKDGGELVAQILGTEVLRNKSGSSMQCAFANVRIPIEYGNGPGKIPLADIGKVAQFIATESAKLQTFFTIILFQGAHWWRISAQCYLEMADIEWGANKMKELCERAKKSEYSSYRSH